MSSNILRRTGRYSNRIDKIVVHRRKFRTGISGNTVNKAIISSKTTGFFGFETPFNTMHKSMERKGSYCSCLLFIFQKHMSKCRYVKEV